MPTETFFDEQTEQSLVKSTIVEKYFDAWAGVITRFQNKNARERNKIAYIDLFAGPGRYKDGAISTPVKIVQKAIDKYSDNLICMFNDKDRENISILSQVIGSISGVERLRFQPKIYCSEVGEEIVKMFESLHLIPTLFFVDPWGYKGLSLQLINSVLKNWGCDCIFFFNYNRINMGINNPCVKSHIEALFGKKHTEQVRVKLSSCNNPEDREFAIIEELCSALKEMGGRFVLPFRFKDTGGKRTSHHLIFVSKHFKGYDIMKGIMAKESSYKEEGVASFEYNAIDRTRIRQGLLFKLTSPLANLESSLLDTFEGQEISMINIYEKHSVDTPFVKSNYKEVLLAMEKKGVITAIRRPKQQKNNFADDVIAKFPRKSNVWAL